MNMKQTRTNPTNYEKISEREISENTARENSGIEKIGQNDLRACLKSSPSRLSGGTAQSAASLAPRNSAAIASSRLLASWTVALRNTRSDLIKHALRETTTMLTTVHGLNRSFALLTLCAFIFINIFQSAASAQGKKSAPARAARASKVAPEPPKKSAKKEKSSNDDKTANKKGDETITPSDLKPFETGIDYEPSSPNKRITFNLEDADLPELVRLISSITGKRFIISSKARSIKATVYAPTKVTVAEAYQAFLSILELNGMALVKSGQYYKIVESGGIENRPIELQTEDGTVPRGDRFLTRLHRLENIASDDAAALLARFKSADGNVTSYAPTNTVIITDTGTNIDRMMRIIKVIDVPHTSENIWIETVYHADTTELAGKLSEIFDATGSSKGSSSRNAKASKDTKGGAVSIGSASGETRVTKIIADERTNSLIIMATDSAYVQILEMLRHLDIAIESEGNVRVHYLQHTDAEEIATTLTKLIEQRPTKGGKGGKEPVTVFEGNIAITANKTSNSLVITSSARDYAALKKTIDRLDVKRRQVFIEAVIMELNVSRTSGLGITYHGGVPNFPTDNSVGVFGYQTKGLASIGGIATNAPELLTGVAVGVQGPQIDVPGTTKFSIPGFGVLLHAVAGSSDANILSTPNLIATDNVEAEISVGSNEPLQTSAVASFGGLGNLAGLAGGTNSSQAGAAMGLLSGMGGLGGTVPRQDVGTTIKITPHINESDEIRLAIQEEISSVGAADTSGNVGVKSVNRTRAKTEVSVNDQQTIVIGGLMRDSVTSSKEKVPILGDIPLIGVLFRKSSKEKVKKNLILFLTPYIIRSPADLRAIYERKMRERQEFLDRYLVSSGIDYEAPIDYSRTRGLISEMLKELTLLDDKRKLEEEAKSKRPEEHIPKESIGTVIANQAEEASAGESQPGGTGPGDQTPQAPGVAQPPTGVAPPPVFNPGEPIPAPEAPQPE
jgi:general secretion pathway protein D